MALTYDIPEVGDGTALLDEPVGVGHAALHDRVKAGIDGIDTRVQALEDFQGTANEDLIQARLTAHTWYVATPVAAPTVLIGPALSNLTGRQVDFSSARITVFGAPTSAALTVDLLLAAPTVSGGRVIDFLSTHMTSILNAPMSIATSENTSVELVPSDFATLSMAEDQFVCPVIKTVGGATGLTIQLNRNL